MPLLDLDNDAMACACVGAVQALKWRDYGHKLHLTVGRVGNRGSTDKKQRQKSLPETSMHSDSRSAKDTVDIVENDDCVSQPYCPQQSDCRESLSSPLICAPSFLLQSMREDEYKVLSVRDERDRELDTETENVFRCSRMVIVMNVVSSSGLAQNSTKGTTRPCSRVGITNHSRYLCRFHLFLIILDWY